MLRVMDDDRVFRALADPTRRHLLDRLFERDGRTLTELLEGVEMSRFGVMKHLRILEGAGMIVTRRAGREKLHFLNAVPVQLIADRWVGKYTRERAAALADLKAVLDEGGAHMSPSATKPRQVYQVYINASPEKVWQAITNPEFTTRYFYGSYVESTFEPKAKLTHYTGDRSAVMVEGEIIEADPPHRLVHSWKLRYDPKFAGDAASQGTWEIASEDGKVSKLTVIHEFLSEDASYAEVASGWSWVVSNLKTLLETGEALPSHN